MGRGRKEGAMLCLLCCSRLCWKSRFLFFGSCYWFVVSTLNTGPTVIVAFKEVNYVNKPESSGLRFGQNLFERGMFAL